jgi:hypothetical protein
MRMGGVYTAGLVSGYQISTAGAMEGRYWRQPSVGVIMRCN